MKRTKKSALKPERVLLPNKGPVKSIFPNLYYPRLQVNRRGEIVLAISKEDTLTSGILVGKTANSTSVVPIGKKFDDWEVVGPLTDYDGEVVVSLKNTCSKGKK